MATKFIGQHLGLIKIENPVVPDGDVWTWKQGGLEVAVVGDGATRMRKLLVKPREALGGAGGSPFVTITELGADDTGVEDCSPVLEAALAAGHRIIFFPAGIYRFATKVNVPAETALIGAGYQKCQIIAQGNWWVECFRSITADLTTDWCRSTVSGFLITMTKGGIRFWGHEFRASELRFSGGNGHMNLADASTWTVDPNAWCIEGIAANEFYLGRLSGGYGGNNGVNTLFANGIRLTAHDVTAEQDRTQNYWPTLPASGQNQRGVNYGDGLLEEISFKGRAENWVGLDIGHQSTSTGVQNMIKAQRIQVQATDVPSAVQASKGTEVSPGLWTWKGSIGVRLTRVRRCLFDTVNTESAETAWDLIGNHRLNEALEPIATISTERTTFIACPTMNSAVNYRDNNETITGAVKDNRFLGGQSFGPMQPTGVTTSPGEGANAIKAGHLDDYLPGQLWLSATQTGLPSTWMRVSPNQDLMFGLVGSPDPGNVLEDSHPRNDKPRRALALRLTTNEAQLRMPLAQGDGRQARLKLGNGTDDPSGGLDYVELADPVRLPKRTTQPNLTGALSRGTTIFADTNAALGGGVVNRWAGPGVYTFLDNGSHPSNFNGHWLPVTPYPGAFQANLGRVGTAYTVDATWFGKLSQHGHGSNVGVVTIPAGLITDKLVDETVTPRSGVWFSVARTGNADVKLVGGTGVTLVHPSVVSNELVIPDKAMVTCMYVRTGAATVSVFIQGM